MSKQDIAAKRKYVTVMIPEKLKTIRGHESGTSHREVTASSNTG
jgi:hypothetical protein